MFEYYIPVLTSVLGDLVVRFDLPTMRPLFAISGEGVGSRSSVIGSTAN